MNPEIKALWLAALRSGKYRQGKGTLHNLQDDTFCCLGVLCEVAVGANIVDSKPRVSGKLTGYGVTQSVSTLPREVVKWAGMPDDAGSLNRSVYGGARDHFSLVDLNDEAGCTFEQIANVIEQQF